MPWPHHRSLFFGLDFVNGGNYWQDSLERGQIISQGPSFARDADGKYKINAVSAEMIDCCLWGRNNEDVVEDNRRFRLKILDDRRYIIDAWITMKALTDIKVEKTNHGLFGVRTSPDISQRGGGFLVNAEGFEGQERTHGKPSRWVAFYGKRAKLREDIIEGIAVFCPSKAPHPKFENCPWFVRDYGFCSPNPMDRLKQDDSFLLSKDEELKLRYRIVAFAGTPKDADLDGLWNEFDNQI